VRRHLNVIGNLVKLTEFDNVLRKHAGDGVAGGIGSLRDPEWDANELGEDLVLWNMWRISLIRSNRSWKGEAHLE
jgi:hypothetical protein